MSDNQNNLNGKDLLIGTLIGAIIGASAALLLAPKAGRETRSDLNRQWVTVKDKTQEMSRTVRDKAREVGQTVKDQSEDVIGMFRDTKNSDQSAVEVAVAASETTEKTAEENDGEQPTED